MYREKTDRKERLVTVCQQCQRVCHLQRQALHCRLDLRQKVDCQNAAKMHSADVRGLCDSSLKSNAKVRSDRL